MKVVLDINVWISGFLWSGVPSQILRLAQNYQSVKVSAIALPDFSRFTIPIC